MITILKQRFEAHMERHKDIPWTQVEKRLMDRSEALVILRRMEESGGEPDVIGYSEDGRLIFCDCAKESPLTRRSLCYDAEALQKRTKNPPEGSAKAQAEKMGVTLLSEQMYRQLQQLGEFDLKTSSWIDTPQDIRRHGGALFCERRYGAVFTFHNGADSYYSSRGWRGMLLV